MVVALNHGGNAARGNWRHVSSQNPCGGCGHPDWCRISEDGATICRRGAFPGSREKRDRLGAAFWMGFPEGVDPRTPEVVADLRPQLPQPERLNKAYQLLLHHSTLTPSHRQHLVKRGFQVSLIKEIGFRSLDHNARGQVARIISDSLPYWQQIPGLYVRDGRPALGGWSGMLIPCRDLEGRITGLRVRADSPDAPKYSYLSSERHGGCGPGAQLSYWPGRGDFTGYCRLIEGELKSAYAAFITGTPAICAPGVSLFCSDQVLEWVKTLGVTHLVLSPDADFRTNRHVFHALRQGIQRLQGLCRVSVEVWHPSAKGLDDAIRAGVLSRKLSPGEFLNWRRRG